MAADEMQGRAAAEAFPDSDWSWAAGEGPRAIIDLLEAARPNSVRFVGGCVRDALRREPIGDIDLATTLLPDDVIGLLSQGGIKTVATGLDHGTVTAVVGGRGFELTTLRADVETDGRRAKVSYTDDWDQDWRRRDFTMNAIYLDPAGCFYDPANGVADAIVGRVRFIGDPEARIQEDYLRILRFYRFFAWCGGEKPDPDAHEACAALHQGVRRLSRERIGHEMIKMARAPAPAKAIEAMALAGVLAEIWPGPCDVEGIVRLQNIEAHLGAEADPIARLSVLFPNAAAALADRLRLSKRQTQIAAAAQAAPDEGENLDEMSLRRVLYRAKDGVGRDGVRVRLLFNWVRCLAPAHDPVWTAAYRSLKTLAIPEFPLRGADALACGIAPGVQIGQSLARIEAEWAAGGFQASRDELLEKLRTLGARR